MYRKKGRGWTKHADFMLIHKCLTGKMKPRQENRSKPLLPTITTILTYNHHEQACAIAAEAYARLENKIAAVCVTTGPGGTNALTGVVGGWLDSIPMFVISGQVRYDTTARYALQFTETPLRAMGDQEYDIVKSVTPMTKYATMIEDPKQIRYALEKGWHLATTGRPGPVWIDIPVNYQGGYS